MTTIKLCDFYGQGDSNLNMRLIIIEVSRLGKRHGAP